MVCIGMHLAQIQLRLAVAYFSRHFTHSKVSKKEDFVEDDMYQHIYFLVPPKGHRCLIDIE